MDKYTLQLVQIPILLSHGVVQKFILFQITSILIDKTAENSGSYEAGPASKVQIASFMTSFYHFGAAQGHLPTNYAGASISGLPIHPLKTNKTQHYPVSQSSDTKFGHGRSLPPTAPLVPKAGVYKISKGSSGTPQGSSFHV